MNRNSRTCERLVLGLAPACLLLSLSGCGSDYYKAYPGPALAQDRVARIEGKRFDGALLRAGKPDFCIQIIAIDEKGVGFWKESDTYAVHVLPGEHRMVVKYIYSLGGYAQEGILLNAEAGATYKLRVSLDGYTFKGSIEKRR